MSEQPEKNQNFLKKAVHFFPAFGGALKEAFQSKDKNLFEKFSIFWDSFKSKMDEIDKEKGEATKEAGEGVKGAVAKTLDETNKAIGFKRGEGETDEEFAENNKLREEIAGMALVASRGLKDEHQGDLSEAMEKLDKAVVGGTPEALTIDQSAALGAVGLGLILQLKRKYPREVEFKAALEKLDKISEGSNYPLKKLLSKSVLKVFMVEIDRTEEVLGSIGSAFGLGEKGPAVQLLGKFEMSTEEAKMLGKLKNSPEEAVDVMDQYIFPKTTRENVQVVARKISEIMKAGDLAGDGDQMLKTGDLAELAFNIDNADMERLIDKLGGK